MFLEIFIVLKRLHFPSRLMMEGGGGKLTPGWDPLTSEHVNDIVMLLF